MTWVHLSESQYKLVKQALSDLGKKFERMQDIHGMNELAELQIDQFSHAKKVTRTHCSNCATVSIVSHKIKKCCQSPSLYYTKR